MKKYIKPSIDIELEIFDADVLNNISQPWNENIPGDDNQTPLVPFF